MRKVSLVRHFENMILIIKRMKRQNIGSNDLLERRLTQYEQNLAYAKAL